MINLRFHIVSIVAVFLALAVGIFAGSTLLDKATVQVIQSNQASLDAKNKALRTENDTLRDVIERLDARTTEFGVEALDSLVGRQLRNDPTLVIATRGIDERGVVTVLSTLRNAGATLLGTFWLDQRADPGGTDDAITKLSEFLELAPPDLAPAQRAATVARVSARLVELLAAPLAAASKPADTSATTTTPAAETLSSVMRRLVDAQLADWEPPSGATGTVPDLPNAGMRTLLLSGEGTEMAPGNIVVPLAIALSSRMEGATIGEIDHPRTLLELAGSKFRRGAVVDPIRSDDKAVDHVVTIDNLDQPFGRLTLVLALADLDQHPSGAYGETSTAQRQFPGGS